MGIVANNPKHRGLVTLILLVVALHAGLASASPSAWELIQQREQFGKFVELVDRAGLRAVLDGQTTLTLLAPVDAAFDALSEVDRAWMNDPAQRSRLRRLVASHILWNAPPTTEIGHVHLKLSAAGRAVTFRRVPVAPADDQELLADEHLPPPTRLMAGAAAVIESDLPTRNGLLHVVDRFIMIDTIRTAPDTEPAATHAPTCDSNTDARDERIRLGLLDRQRRLQRARQPLAQGDAPVTDASIAKSGPSSRNGGDADRTPPEPPPPPVAPMPRGPDSGGGGGGCGMR